MITIYVPEINIYTPIWEWPEWMRKQKSILASPVYASGGGPVVTANTGSVSNNDMSGPTFANLQYNSSGEEFENSSPTSNNVTLSRGNWLDEGLSSEVWIERTINSGSLNNGDAGSGRLQLSTSRLFGNTRVADGQQTANITFDFYDAASGGSLLDTVTFSIQANVNL